MKTTIILPDPKYKRLKSIAYKKKTSLAKVINEALDLAYFTGDSLSFKSLKGIGGGNKSLSLKEIQTVKIKPDGRP
jgi:hypothetical protein